MKKLLITDLDNTLYDWVTFFASSFKEMLYVAQEITGISTEVLLEDFKFVHQKYRNSEHPFALLELPSINKLYPNKSFYELKEILDPAFYAFNKTRKKYLTLYPDVLNSFQLLNEMGVTIIGYTEATAINAIFRLKGLGILDHFKMIYAHKSLSELKNYSSTIDFEGIIKDKIRYINHSERKPNPVIIEKILKDEKLNKDMALYIGDSLAKDIGMAKNSGVTSVWAKYGTTYDKTNWSLLVKITHWTDEDVQREEQIQQQFKDVKPDYTIECFSEIIDIIKMN